MTPLIELKGVTKTFGRRGVSRNHFCARGASAVLNGVSFRLMPGESLGIIGISGSGKSTIAKAITRLIDVTDGRIFLDGADITRAKGAALRPLYSRVQMIFQNPASSFDPRRTLGSGIEEGMRNAGMSRSEARERAVSLLESCGLSADFSDRLPHEVSGGECQRAAIARALAAKPDVLICDEATSALDATVQRQIMTLLASLRHNMPDMAYIFISHNLALVQQFCTRVLVLGGGVVAEEGKPDEIISYPRSAYTRQLVEAAECNAECDMRNTG